MSLLKKNTKYRIQGKITAIEEVTEQTVILKNEIVTMKHMKTKERQYIVDGRGTWLSINFLRHGHKFIKLENQ